MWLCSKPYKRTRTQRQHDPKNEAKFSPAFVPVDYGQTEEHKDNENPCDDESDSVAPFV